jgi:signal transduction histidine kinase
VSRWTDAGLIGLAAGLGTLFFLDTNGPGTPIDLAVGVAACLALLLRRRWPVVLALVLNRREYWQGVVVVLALDAALVASGLLVRSLRERAREAEERQRLRIEEARHAERERLAREMHDVLAHRISLLAVHAGALEVRRSAPDDERQAAAVIRQCAYDALEDLREVIGMLREEPNEEVKSLHNLIEQSTGAGTPVTLETETEIPEHLSRHVYRVVQEGLTNARKHAPGAPVLIRLDDDSDGLTVAITNPIPAPPQHQLPGAGSGLIGLTERMHLVGGRLEHGRTGPGEFRLQAWLPRKT